MKAVFYSLRSNQTRAIQVACLSFAALSKSVFFNTYRCRQFRNFGVDRLYPSEVVHLMAGMSAMVISPQFFKSP